MLIGARTAAWGGGDKEPIFVQPMLARSFGNVIFQTGNISKSVIHLDSFHCYTAGFGFTAGYVSDTAAWVEITSSNSFVVKNKSYYGVCCFAELEKNKRYKFSVSYDVKPIRLYLACYKFNGEEYGSHIYKGNVGGAGLVLGDSSTEYEFDFENYDYLGMSFTGNVDVNVEYTDLKIEYA